MKPPGLSPECPRGHPVGTSADRRLVAVGMILVGLPLLVGATGGIWIADEALGPVITLVVWLAMFIIRAVRSRGGIYFIEWIAVVGGLVMLQLLLDLHTRHLGDIVIALLHAPFLIGLLIAAWRARKRQPRSGRHGASAVEDD